MFHAKSWIVARATVLVLGEIRRCGGIAGPRDIPYPGTLALSVDLTDLDRRAVPGARIEYRRGPVN